jgi:hypothetical protein
MPSSPFLRLYLPCALLLAMLAGCAGSNVNSNLGNQVAANSARVTADVAGRQVAASAASATVLYVHVQSEQHQAVFQIDDAAITVSQTQVSWGQNQSVALPANWRQMELIGSGKGVAIRVDGKPFWQIGPA